MAQREAQGIRTHSAGVLERAVLILLMAIGSIAMWVAVPLGLVYAVSRMVHTTAPQMGPYVVILIGVPLGMTIIGKALGALDRHYARRTGAGPERYRPGWQRSMRGERRPAHAGNWKVLDVVMMSSVVMAATAMGLWFAFLSGPPI